MGKIRQSLQSIMRRRDCFHRTVQDRIEAHYAKYEELLAKNKQALATIDSPGWADIVEPIRRSCADAEKRWSDEVIDMAAKNDMTALVTALTYKTEMRFLRMAETIKAEHGRHIEQAKRAYDDALQEQKRGELI